MVDPAGSQEAIPNASSQGGVIDADQVGAFESGPVAVVIFGLDDFSLVKLDERRMYFWVA